MVEPDVLGYGLDQARAALERSGCEVVRIVQAAGGKDAKGPLRVVRQRCTGERQVELTVAAEVALRIGE